MKSMKKILFLMFAGIFLFSGTVYANDENVVVVRTEEQANDNEGIMPLYTYIDVISAGLGIDENGHCVFSGSVTALDYDVKLEIYLQRSRNQLFWDEIMGGIKTFDQSGSLEYSLNLQPDDYYYRTKVVVSVLDSNKNVLETETVYSDSERY